MRAAHHEQQESGHQAQTGLSGSTAFAYRTTDNPGVQQCKADIDIHHGNMGEHGGTKWNRDEVRGNNILSPQSTRYDNYHI